MGRELIWEEGCKARVRSGELCEPVLLPLATASEIKKLGD